MKKCKRLIGLNLNYILAVYFLCKVKFCDHKQQRLGERILSRSNNFTDDLIQSLIKRNDLIQLPGSDYGSVHQTIQDH